MMSPEERAKWELEHRLWDFLEFLTQEKHYCLAQWHSEGPCKACGRNHMLDQLMDTTDFLERRNLPREFLDLETWQESEKKADELLAELREKRAKEK